MRGLLMFAGGVAVGVLVGAKLRPNDSVCCAAIKATARQKLGPFAGIGDALGLIDLSPKLLGIYQGVR